MEEKITDSEIPSKLLTKSRFAVVETACEENKDGIIYAHFIPVEPCHVITNETTQEEIRSWNPEYYDFMEKYRKEHCCCPKCGSKHLTSTLVCYTFNHEHPEDYVDYNSNLCMDCGWSGITDDLVPEKDTNE